MFRHLFALSFGLVAVLLLISPAHSSSAPAARPAPLATAPATAAPAAAAPAAAAPAASNGQSCAPRAHVLERLASAYGETRRGIGLGRGNVVIEVFASDRTGSWTIAMTTTDGTTCLIATGLSYEDLAEELPHPSRTDT
ncbi:hypothetical protein [Brevirhabdus sp.]|uniref:hypothetical protein n=1 Tax=Brevirhabdus sp. TaxID=2004514 RepID=UPI00405A277C